MKKRLLYIVNFFWFSIASCLFYYLLVQNNTLHLSIARIIEWASHCTKNGHILVIGLLPIYIALIIFGAAVLFIYLRSTVWPILSHYLNHWLHLGRKS